ncbi:hypothetical protein V2G26_009681 [Clonostachys chloroleuca]
METPTGHWTSSSPRLELFCHLAKSEPSSRKPRATLRVTELHSRTVSATRRRRTRIQLPEPIRRIFSILRMETGRDQGRARHRRRGWPRRRDDYSTCAGEAQRPPKPPDFQFSARMPHINQKDLDVIRLTALFVAKNGRQFMTQLAQRETGNPQFQFLIPNHTFHNFFQHIIDQYTKLLRAGGVDGEGGKQQQEVMDGLAKDVKDKLRILNRARERAEYSKFQESEKQKKEEEEEEKKAEFLRIDWGDFVVVETINFTESDEKANLPPPTNLAELQYASLEDRNKASIASNMRIEEAFPGEAEEMANGNLPAAQLPSYPLPAHPGHAVPQPNYPAQAPPAQNFYPGAPPRSAQEEEELRRIQERSDAQARMHNAQAEARGGIAPMKIRGELRASGSSEDCQQTRDADGAVP